MMFAWLASILRRHAPTPAASRPESETERIAKVRQLRVDDEAPYWCRACARGVHHPQCPICRGRTWVREIGLHSHDPMPPSGGAA